MSNAVKYSPEGGEIRIMLRESGMQMELEIEDEGPGIDIDEREQVFEPFSAARPSKVTSVSKVPDWGWLLSKNMSPTTRAKSILLTQDKINMGLASAFKFR
jgi:two-component system, NtrC family, sensor histidine kinase GlrK